MMHPISAVHRLARCALLSLACAALLLTACADYKTPAKETLAKVELSLNNVARDAAKYAPAELKQVQDDLAAAKAKFDDGDYEQALLGARGVASAVPKLATTAGQKRTEFMKQLADDWQKMSTELPKTMDGIGTRIARLAKSKSPPAGFDQAKTDFDAAKQTLTEATKASSLGNLEEAVTKAKAVSDKAKELMAALGMKSA
jgi:DNA repair exonuclease SbcCD ATPase subunit